MTRLINGPEAFTPDNEFCLGESEVRGLFVAAGFCAHGLAGAGGIGKVMAEWIIAGEPSLDVWEMDIRRFGPHYRSPELHAQAGQGGLRDLLRHPLPGPRAPGRAAAARLERLPLAPRARCRVRREVRLGARQLVRLQRAGRRRVAAPARLGGDALVAGDRRRAPRPRARRRGCSTSPRSRSSRSPDRARPSCSSACATTRRARRRRDHLHADAQPPRRDRVRLHGHPRRAGCLSRSSPEPRSATTTRAGSAATCPTTARSASATSPRAGPASRCGARRRTRSSRR